MVNCLVTVPESESVTRIVNVDAPPAEGVPLMSPELLLRLRPEGSEPTLTE